MRKIILLLLALLCFALTAHADVIKMNCLTSFCIYPNNSTWYDEYGQLACIFNVDNLTFIEKGKTYRVQDITRKDVPIKLSNGMIGTGMAQFLMLNENGKIAERKISAVRHSKGTIIFLILPDYPTALQSTKTVDYAESVGGVYLGMPRRLVEQLYGGPDSVSENYGIVTAKYSRDGWEIKYEGNRVTQITMHKGGTRRFDRTGLGCDSSLDSFARAYKFSSPIHVIDWNNFRPTGGGLIPGGSSTYAAYLYFVNNGDIILSYEAHFT